MDAVVVRVFSDGPTGGNPAPIVLDADGAADGQMLQLARSSGLESGFVVAPPPGAPADLALRFFMPEQEVDMCVHATAGAVWLLDRAGRLPGPSVTVATPSGTVRAEVVADSRGGRTVRVSQPVGRVTPLPHPDVDRAAVLDVLGISPFDLGDRPLRNATTSRTKTLVPLADVARLDALAPDPAGVRQVCDRLGSTGLYPYAVSGAGGRVVDARQFPRGSGYPEDAATGVAAAALASALLADGLIGAGGPVRVRQGRAMGRPSAMDVSFDLAGDRPTRCWVGGSVHVDDGGPGAPSPVPR